MQDLPSWLETGGRLARWRGAAAASYHGALGTVRQNDEPPLGAEGERSG